MEQIEIGFSRPTNVLFPFGSWAIRLYQNSEYSHVYIKIFSKKLNRYMIYEAVGNGGVRFIGLDQWKKKAKEVESFNLNVESEKTIELLQFLVDTCGIDYGFMQNIGIVYANFFGKPKNPWRKGKNCSEAVADFLVLNGFKINKSHDLVTPKDIHKVLSNLNEITNPR